MAIFFCSIWRIIDTIFVCFFIITQKRFGQNRSRVVTVDYAGNYFEAE